MKSPVVLRIYREEKLEEVRQFEQSQIVIGRNSDVHVELKDEAVAGLHAMIEERGSDYMLSDLGSKTGTFRNGNKILEEKIQSGDEIKIGPFRLQFSVGIPKAVVATATSTGATAASAPTPSAPVATPPAPKREEPKREEPKVVAPPPPVPPPKQKEEKKPVFAPIAPKFSAPAASTGSPNSKRKSKKTFAPPSPYRDLNEVVKPGKGSMVEVLVAWKDRVISSHHFQKQGAVYIGNDDKADIPVPILASGSRFQLLKMGAVCTVCLTPDMTGEVTKDGETVSFSELARQNKLRSGGSGTEYELRQGEMLRLNLQDTLSLIIRYKAESPKPLVAPLLDLTASEVTGVILAAVIASIFALYMNIYAPSNLLEDEARIEEPLRKAVVTFNPPKPKQIVEVKEEATTKKVVEVKEKPRQATAPAVEKKGDPGKAGEVAPKPTKDKEKKLTSAKPGGAVKTSPKEGAQAKSEKPDPTKVGLLSAFGSKGMQSKLDKAYSGSGELTGMADSATGHAGNAETRPGEGMGTKLKDTGAGGKGTSTVGIAGLGTQGRGTGTTGYGTGGIGKKGSVDINVGGQDAEVGAGIDKEAIRRVIREHIREIRTCYERELQRSPDLYGKISIEWDIEDKGRVTSARVKENALGNANVANCIVSRLKTWTFPSPPADQVARVVYPFVFTAQ